MTYQSDNFVGRMPVIQILEFPEVARESNTVAPAPPATDNASGKSASTKSLVAAVFASSIAVAAVPIYGAGFSNLDLTRSGASSTSSANSANSTPNNSSEMFARVHLYRKLRQTIQGLPELDEDDPHYLDSETAAAGLEFLAFIQDFSVPPPRIFPHGGDALVFEWENSEYVRYVTYEDFIARLRDQGANIEYADPLNLDVRQGSQASNLIQALGGQQWRVMRPNSAI